MAGEVVNLRVARKAAERAAKEREAAANRAAHGRSKAHRQRDAESEGRRNALLDGARREDSETP